MVSYADQGLNLKPCHRRRKSSKAPNFCAHNGSLNVCPLPKPRPESPVGNSVKGKNRDLRPPVSLMQETVLYTKFGIAQSRNGR